MNTISYTSARQNLSKTMNHVCSDHEPVIISSKRDKAVVMISLDDYKALEETAYLLRSPRNALRLMESIKQIQEGYSRERELIACE